MILMEDVITAVASAQRIQEELERIKKQFEDVKSISVRCSKAAAIVKEIERAIKRLPGKVKY